MASEVTLTCQMGRPRVQTTGGSQLAYALVEIQAAGGSAGTSAATRMPLNLALALDHSGSMRGEKLRSVKEAVKLVIDHMSASDIVSVIVFDDNVKVIVPAQPVRDPELLKAAVDGIRDGGGTSMSLGMNVAMTELRKNASPHLVNRMILLTDGATYGDADRCRRIADDAGASGIGIYPLGIGADWEEDLLDNIGQRSSGLPAEFIRRPEDALGIFQQQLQSAESVVAQNAQLTVRLYGGVTSRRAVRVLPLIADLGPSVLSDNHVVVGLGDIERTAPQAILLELMVEGKPAGVFRIAQAELAYDLPSGQREVTRADAIVTFTTEPVASDDTNPQVMNYAEKATAARLVTRVLDEYKSQGKVTIKLNPAVTRVLDPETQRLLEQLQAGGKLTGEELKTIGAKTRKLTQSL
ncbi:MAG: VWA domain-containing protein [Chloroflexota bacterium]|nr:VWA domain-containing protein [Chloroflexota bacterium]